MVLPWSLNEGKPYEMPCCASGTIATMVSRSWTSVARFGSSRPSRYLSISFLGISGYGKRGAVGAAFITLRRARNDMIDASDPAEPIDSAEAAEQIENAEAADPIDPIESTEPTEPIESTEPWEPIDRSEFSDQSDHLDRSSRCPRGPVRPFKPRRP